MGGGSLGDVGCYCVSGLRLAFACEPHRASAFARFDEEGADRELASVLEFDSELGIVPCSISSARRERMEIVGEEGRISLDAPFRADKVGSKMEITRGGKTSTETFETADRTAPSSKSSLRPSARTGSPPSARARSSATPTP